MITTPSALLSLLLSAAPAPVPAAAPPPSVTAGKIASVVVYPDRAQVTRVLTVDCGLNAAARFGNLPPAMDPSTVRARSDQGEIAGLRTEEEPRAEAYARDRATLDEQVRTLSIELARTREGGQRAEQRDRIARELSDLAAKMIDRELAAPKPNTRAWVDAFDKALAERVTALTGRVAATAKDRELTRGLRDLELRRGLLDGAAARHAYVADVVVSCPSGRQARVELTYLVGGAGWEPIYEARAEEAAGRVELSTFATVHQSTGEDWSAAHLLLSTALPVDNATPPEISPLKVSAEQHEPEKKVIVRRDEQQEHAEAADFKDAAPDRSGSMASAAQGLSVQLHVPEAADVPADGKPVRLFVSRTRLKARFSLRTVPKLLPFVFKVAELVNTEAFPLLPALLDAYGKTGFLSRSAQERVPQGGAFRLTFGMEDRMRVKREVVSEIQRDAGLFGSTRRYHYAYRFTVGNYTGGAQQLELSEHIPVSELDDVKVELEPKTTAGAAINAPDGIVTWTLKLAPSEEKVVDLAFHVDVPSSYAQ